MTIPVIIPAYRPGPGLVELVESLTRMGVADLVVVDDGSGPEFAGLFERAAAAGRCRILTHAVNLGKGRALKTAFNHALREFPDLAGVVTADADGQHLPEDILKVRDRLAADPHGLVLGVRSFTGDVPLRSRLGNLLTRRVFRALVGLGVSDTQTGLRGIPKAFLPACLTLPGEGFEFETNMLIATVPHAVPTVEVTIRTVYLEQNRSSHFNPVRDSMRIYFVLFRFLLSSLATSLVDFLVFTLAALGGLGVPLGTLCARLVAGTLNYVVNRRVVFGQPRGSAATLLKYWALVALLGGLSYAGIQFLVGQAGVHLFAAKAAVESALFIASFAIQRDFIFNRRMHDDPAD